MALSIVLFFGGLLVGSFLNVCIYRLPRNESVVFPPSHCPRCHHRLHWLDLFPVFSYLLLGGRCRYCQEKIFWRYPLVELLTGLAFGAAILAPNLLTGVVQTLLLCLLIMIFFIDLEQQMVLDSLNVSGIILGLGYNFLLGQDWVGIFGLATGFAVLLSIAKFGRWLFNKEALGDGDPFIGALLGAYLGWQGALLSIFLAYLMAFVVVIILLARQKVKFGGTIPFGPALVAGGVITMFFGRAILSWYLGMAF